MNPSIALPSLSFFGGNILLFYRDLLLFFMLLLFSSYFQRNASRSGAARGYICSFADVLKFADGPAPAPVGAGVPGSPHRRTAKYRRTFA